MTVTTFNYEGSYLPGVICNIVVKADLGRSAGRSTPPLLTSCGQEWQLADLPADLTPLVLTSSGQDWQLADYPPNASWDIYYGMYLAAILDSSRKVGNFLLFLNN